MVSDLLHKLKQSSWLREARVVEFKVWPIPISGINDTVYTKKNKDGAKIKAIGSTLSKKLHVSNSTFATFFFPIILSLKKNDSIELEFEETYEELIEKEIELLQ